MKVSPELNLTSTGLYRRLIALEGADDPILAPTVRQLCSEAADRLRIFPAFHQQYTLHDDVHSLRVVVLMEKVLGTVMEELNSVEVALLILAAYYHDQGMIVESADMAELRMSEDWRLHDAQWSREHPNRAELLDQLRDPLLNEDQRTAAAAALAELEAASFSDFVRRRHGEWTAAYIRWNFGQDERFVINGRNVADLLARVCHSHVLPAEALLDTSMYRLAEHVGTELVNVSLIAMVLRLADILDFDRDRTPDSLYRAITFTSQVSLTEWEKHRSIVGWEISQSRIAFTAECGHPAYERAIRAFIAWIEDELKAVVEWNRRLPSELAAHRIDLPTSVDTSGVGPRPDPITGKPSYLYLDLEFTLARDELVKLLMTNELYQSPGLFVRELLQNAMDALRHRSALFRAAGVSPPAGLSVQLTHSQDAAGYDVVTCVDNGVGMDLAVVSTFLTRAGRSYYRSPEFERERALFQSAGCDFDPCARFGIGFMSCFMFGDDIMIHTRRDHGQGKAWEPPLIVHVTGLSGIVLIKEGSADQPVGTRVEIRGRRKSFIVDEWDDRVLLRSVVEGYALATEFPIRATVTVPGLESDVAIPTVYSARRHPLEDSRLRKTRLFSVRLDNHDAQLNGELRLCALVNEKGLIATATPEATIVARHINEKSSRKDVVAVLPCGSEINIGRDHERVQICADGILIAGVPGREKRETRLGHYSAQLYYGGVSALIDARGDLKPSLTPARTPPRDHHREDHTWARLDVHVGRVYARLFDEVFSACDTANDPSSPWTIAAAYSLRLERLPLSIAWSKLEIPTNPAGSQDIEWLSLDAIRTAQLTFESGQQVEESAAELTLPGGAALALPSTVAEFLDHQERESFLWTLRVLICASAVVRVQSPMSLHLEVARPSNLDHVLLDFGFGTWPSRMNTFAIADVEGTPILRVYGLHGFANRSHPVVKHVAGSAGLAREERAPIDSFLSTLLWNWPLITSDAESPKQKWIARTRAKLAYLYSVIDWQSVSPELAPPYTAFIPGVGLQTLTTDQLRSWPTRLTLEDLVAD